MIAVALLLFFSEYQKPTVLAQVRILGLSESSGVVASKRFAGVYWTHNDDDPYLYAVDTKGQRRAKVQVTGAHIFDWEGLALGPNNELFIGNIGDNQRARESITVYRIPEPNLTDRQSKPAQVIRFTYPDAPHDAEALLVHPKTGEIYIVTKAKGQDRRTLVYKGSRAGGILKQIGEVNLPAESIFSLWVGRITGGDISPDGSRVVLCDYFRAWEAIAGGGGSFDKVWSGQWQPVDVGRRQQGEAIAYTSDGRALIVTSEGATFSLVEVKRN